MNNFLFAIQNMQALNTTPEKQPAQRTTTKQVLNPEGLALRVFKDGRVYPSAGLVEHFNLEYQLEGEQPNPAQGLDVFLAHDLPNFNKNIPNALLVAPVAKSEAKVDLLKNTEYNEDGTPKSSVLTQGSSTFGKSQLLPMLEIVLGKELSEIFGDNKFIDLRVEVDYQLPIAGDFLYIPKTIRKGERKGEVALIRRNATNVFPVSILGTESTEPTLTEQEFPADHMEEAELAVTAPEYVG